MAEVPRRLRATMRAILGVTAGHDLLKCRLYPDPRDPTKRTLVERTDIPRRTFQRHLAGLVAAGVMVCELSGNRGRIPEYRIVRPGESVEPVPRPAVPRPVAACAGSAPAAWARIADPDLRADALALFDPDPLTCEKPAKSTPIARQSGVLSTLESTPKWRA